MAQKRLALNVNGDITYCTCSLEERGKGRCNHIAHQENGENPQEFVERIEKLQNEIKEKSLDDSNAFIPYEGTEIQTSPYRMTDEEKEKLVKIENRMQLDQNIDGGYMELEEPLWNDMDKNFFSQMSGIKRKNLDAVLHGDAVIVLDSDDPKFPIGKVVFPAKPDEDEEVNKKISPIDALKADLQLRGITSGYGVTDLNKFAEDTYQWKATQDVYVLPYYMRMSAGEDIPSDLTVAYKYLLRNHADPDRQQLAYEALLNNTALDKEKARYSNGFRNKSLADEFVGKGGVFRACLSGGSIPYSGRAVITPTLDMNYGECKIPPSMAVDIFKPTLLQQLYSEGCTMEEVDRYFAKFRVPQTEVDPVDRLDLQLRISDRRVLLNRQPSLHESSLQSFRPKISENGTIQIHPLYCESYGADYDGDCMTCFAINQENMVPLVDKTLDAHLEHNIKKPRSQETSAILPSKDGLFGLINILSKRSNG